MMLEPMVDESAWIQCTACNRWRLLPPGMSADGLPEPWFCHTEPFNRNCDVAEVAETLPDPVIAVEPYKPSAANTDFEVGEEPICTSKRDSKSSFQIFVPRRKRSAILKSRSECRFSFMQIAHHGPLDKGRNSSTKKTKPFHQRSIKRFFPKKTVLIQKSIKSKTKFVQKRIKDFFPGIQYFEAMEKLRQSIVNCVNRGVKFGNSRTVIMNITAGFRRPRGKPRKRR